MNETEGFWLHLMRHTTHQCSTGFLLIHWYFFLFKFSYIIVYTFLCCFKVVKSWPHFWWKLRFSSCCLPKKPPMHLKISYICPHFCIIHVGHMHFWSRSQKSNNNRPSLPILLYILHFTFHFHHSELINSLFTCILWNNCILAALFTGHFSQMGEKTIV